MRARPGQAWKSRPIQALVNHRISLKPKVWLVLLRTLARGFIKELPNLAVLVLCPVRFFREFGISLVPFSSVCNYSIFILHKDSTQLKGNSKHKKWSLDRTSLRDIIVNYSAAKKERRPWSLKMLSSLLLLPTRARQIRGHLLCQSTGAVVLVTLDGTPFRTLPQC